MMTREKRTAVYECGHALIEALLAPGGVAPGEDARYIARGVVWALASQLEYEDVEALLASCRPLDSRSSVQRDWHGPFEVPMLDGRAAPSR